MTPAQRVGCAIALAICTVAGVADACPCEASLETFGAWTASNERWGLFIANTGRLEIGSWDSAGRFHGEPSRVHAIDGTSAFVAALRPVPRLELSASIGAGGAWMQAPGVESTNGGLTDTTARVRYEIVPDRGEPTQFTSGTWLTVRAPTGSNSAAEAGSTAGIIGAFGLGSWEAAYGLDLRSMIVGRWRPFVSGEFALRVPDQTLGESRLLGPRAGVATGLDYFVGERAAISAIVAWGWEGNVQIDGQTLARSWQQRTSVVVAGTLFATNGVRGTLAAAADLPVDGLGRNGSATFRVAFTLGYAAATCDHACDAHAMPMAARTGLPATF